MIDVETALRTERTIDIVTIGRRTGQKRVTEIWFTNIEGRIIICGTASADGRPGRRRPRDWLANLKANPAFQFCFKGAQALFTRKGCSGGRSIGPTADHERTCYKMVSRAGMQP